MEEGERPFVLPFARLRKQGVLRALRIEIVDRLDADAGARDGVASPVGDFGSKDRCAALRSRSAMVESHATALR
jgi:hypothetical protein